MDRLYKIARIAKIAGIAKIEEQETQPLGDRDITEIEKARQLTAEAAENRERRLGFGTLNSRQVDSQVERKGHGSQAFLTRASLNQGEQGEILAVKSGD